MAGAQQQAPMHSTSSSENRPSARDALVADAQLLLEALVDLVAAAQHATDVGADLHVVFARRLEAQHGVVAGHVAHFELGDADALRPLRRSPRRRGSRPRPARRAAWEPAPSGAPGTSRPARRSAPPAGAKSVMVSSLIASTPVPIGCHIHLPALLLLSQQDA